MMNHNQNITTRKFELQAFVDVINTADAYKLSRLSKYFFCTKLLFISRIMLHTAFFFENCKYPHVDGIFRKRKTKS